MQAVARNNVCVCARVWIQTSYILTIHNNNHEAEEQLCKGQFTENVPTGSGRCKVCIDASKRNATEWEHLVVGGGPVGGGMLQITIFTHRRCRCNINGLKPQKSKVSRNHRWILLRSKYRKWHLWHPINKSPLVSNPTSKSRRSIIYLVKSKIIQLHWFYKNRLFDSCSSLLSVWSFLMNHEEQHTNHQH